MATLPHIPRCASSPDRTPAQLRAQVARAVNIAALLAFPLFVLMVFALPSSGAALVALAALALGFAGFLGGATYAARATGATGLCADHAAPDSTQIGKGR